MTPTITWGIVASLLVARAIYRWRRQYSLERTLCIQETRERFARIRRDVVRLMHDGQLPPTSKTAGMLYLASSAMVRRTNRYPEFAAGVFHALAERSPAPSDIQAEVSGWTPDVREVFINFFEHVSFMVQRVYPPIRVALWLDHRTGVLTALAGLFTLARKVAKAVGRGSTMESGIDILRANNQMKVIVARS